MDETYGRDVAATGDITTRGTADLVLERATGGAISVDDARTVIDGMIDEGWYCAPDVSTKIVQNLESLADRLDSWSDRATSCSVPRPSSFPPCHASGAVDADRVADPLVFSPSARDVRFRTG